MLLGDMFKNGPMGDPNQRQMIGLQMLANSGPSVGAPGNLFAGMPQAVMAGKQMSEKQREKIQEEERKRMIAKALVGIDGVNPDLAGIDPGLALKVAEFSRGKDNGKSEKEEQIIRLMETGLDRNTAIGIVDRRLDVSVNPVTGERGIIDVGTNTFRPTQGNPTPVPEAGTINGPSLWDQADNATGVGATIKRGLSDTMGQIPGPIGDMATSPKTVRAQQDFKLFQRDIVRSLSLNPRFPVAEMQRLEGLIPQGAFTDPSTMREAMRTMDAEMQRIEAQAMAGLQDPNSPIEQRKADADTVRAVRQARARMGIPQANTGSGAGGSSALKEKYGLE